MTASDTFKISVTYVTICVFETYRESDTLILFFEKNYRIDTEEIRREGGRGLAPAIQAVYELQVRNALYWFTSDDEQEIQRHNRPYQQASSIEEVLTNLFVPATDHQRENLWQVQDIQKELGKHLKASDVPNIIKLGKILKALRWPRGGNTGTRGYYLQLKKS